MPLDDEESLVGAIVGVLLVVGLFAAWYGTRR
jgi:hypothetical protein